MQSEPATWPQRYDMQRFHYLLEDDGALTTFLKTHIKEHPEDQAAREFLADMPRLRFIYDPNGDAEEDVDDGAVSLWSNDLDLIHDTDPDNNKDQVVGIRFEDISVPQGARIKRAYVQFTAYPEDPGSEKTDLVLHAELGANAERFAKVNHNVSSRRKTAAPSDLTPCSTATAPPGDLHVPYSQRFSGMPSPRSHQSLASSSGHEGRNVHKQL